MYQDEASQPSCKTCATGRKPETKGSASCLACLAGLFVTDDGGCLVCSEGSFTNSSDLKSCFSCDAGQYQDQKGKASCLPCIPGSYNNLTGQTSCSPCAENTISSVPAATSCFPCGIGEFAEEGSARSQRCGAGTFGNGCLKCPLETARNSSDSDVTQCRQCKLGETTTTEGAAVCDKW